MLVLRPPDRVLAATETLCKLLGLAVSTSYTTHLEVFHEQIGAG